MPATLEVLPDDGYISVPVGAGDPGAVAQLGVDPVYGLVVIVVARPDAGDSGVFAPDPGEHLGLELLASPRPLAEGLTPVNIWLTTAGLAGFHVISVHPRSEPSRRDEAATVRMAAPADN